MSFARFNRDLKKLTPGDRLGQALNARRLNALADLTKAAVMGQNVRGGPGIRVRSGPGGVTITSTVRGGRGGSCPHQWRPRIVGEDGDDALVSINSGYFRGLSPILGESGTDTLEEDPDSTLAMPKAGTSYAYVRADIERVLSVSDTFVVDGDVTDLRVVCTETLQTNSVDAGVYRRWYLLFTKEGGRFTQHRYWNIGCVIDDDGTATQTPRFTDHVASS